MKKRLAYAVLLAAGVAQTVACNGSGSISTEELMKAFPKGTILAWYPGPTDKVPAGWALCDGANSTPNLQSQFLVGADSFANISELGKPVGSASHEHGVSARARARDAGDNWGPLTRHDAPETTGLNHEHPVTGGTDSRPNIPPSVKVFYIIKL